MNFQDYIRKFPNFPKKGIEFCDVSPLLAAPAAWQAGIDEIAGKIAAYKPDILAGIESRGFLMAAPIAYKLGIGFFMLRKKGKLPGKVIGQDYALEYGTDRIEIQADAIKPGQKVIVADDLLATGGTMAAGVKLLQGLGTQVLATAVFIELRFLNGARRLDVPCLSLIRYD